ncbi:MAG: immunoglobulin domain-containing protein [Verrucomicrobiae bacterium]|nr:immunoglobulin domain-containing protein [Verrucomicrobiae bacterium]
MRTAILIVLFMGARMAFADSLPIFTLQPANQTVPPGSTATFTASASGATSYQWLFNGTNISGATSATLQVVNAQPANCGYYGVIAKNATGWAPSGMAYLFLDYTFGGTVFTGEGMLPRSNTNNTYFQGDIESGGTSTWPDNGTVQIMAGPQLDEMQPAGLSIHYSSLPIASRFYNGYYKASDQSVSTISPGQPVYYSVMCQYTNGGFFYFQQSTVMMLNAGTNGSSAPPAYGLKFPVWFASEGPEPFARSDMASPSTQVRVGGETISLTNSYFGYNDFGVPSFQWRKNGVLAGSRQSFTPDPIVPGESSSCVTVLTITNAQPSDAGVYDVDVRGNNWFIGQKIYISIQTTNGQGVFQAPKFLGTNFVCDLTGAAGRSYEVQQSTNLENWSDLVTLSNTTGSVTFTNPPAASSPRFYRTVLVPQ